MAKRVEYADWPDAPDVRTPTTPAVAGRGGRTVYFAGARAAPVIFWANMGAGGGRIHK